MIAKSISMKPSTYQTRTTYLKKNMTDNVMKQIEAYAKKSGWSVTDILLYFQLRQFNLLQVEEYLKMHL